MDSRKGVTQKGKDKPKTAMPMLNETTGSRSIKRFTKRPMLNAIWIDLEYL
jgi:hypothetical protein|eukprot:evm.model.NODE_12390_length_20121_cov_16.951593.1